MPSSTSSSDGSAARKRQVDFGADLHADARHVALRTAVAGLLILGAGLAFARCNIALVDPLMAGKKRLREALAALPEVAAHPGATGDTGETSDTALFFGSSLVWNGFSPEIFDARLDEHGVQLASFNFGFGGLNPEIQLLLARRIRAAFEAEGRRLRLALVEFNPFQSTRARAREDERVRDQHRMMLATPAEIARLALESPDRGARYFTGRYLRNSISPEAVTAAFGGIVSGIGELVEAGARGADQGSAGAAGARPSPEERAQMDTRTGAALDFRLGLLEVHRGIPPMWDLEFRGDPQFDHPETHEALEILSRPADWELREDLARRIRCCDIEELRFDERLVADFIALLGELAAVSERTEVVLMPVNHAWVKRSPAALERLREVVRRIARETGLPVLDFQSPPSFDASHFWDATHLTPSGGMRAFSVFLADHYVPSLIGPIERIEPVAGGVALGGAR
jgi:hypothetical protein